MAEHWIADNDRDSNRDIGLTGDHIYDPDFEGSIFQQLGHQAELCPQCKAHLYNDGICLNACHLSEVSRKRFNATMAEIAERHR